MGATKLHVHHAGMINLALVSRALAHPARIKIVKLLDEYGVIRNIDLISQLALHKSTIHDHLQKLKEAGLIHYDFHPNSYSIRLNAFGFDELIAFLKKVSD